MNLGFLSSLLLLAFTFFIGAVVGVSIRRSIHEAEATVMEQTIEKLILELTKGNKESYESDTVKINIAGDGDE